MSLGEKLRSAREEAGFTHEEVAERLNAHRQTVGRYERGERQPSYPTVAFMAGLYGKPIGWFFDDPDESDESVFWSVQVALRSLGGQLSDEGLKAVQAFIEFTHARERGES